MAPGVNRAGDSGAPRAEVEGARVEGARVEAWLADLGLAAFEVSEREGVTSWDLRLDGRRRFDVRVTIILVPASGLFVWVPLAPPISDGLRKAYKAMLEWNEQYPFVKFALAADDRPVLTAEIPAERMERDELGTAIARVLLVCDLVLDVTRHWTWIGGRLPDEWADRPSRHLALAERYADRLGELAEGG